jgi:hypothetical protein
MFNLKFLKSISVFSFFHLFCIRIIYYRKYVHTSNESLKHEFQKVRLGSLRSREHVSGYNFYIKHFFIIFQIKYKNCLVYYHA